MIQFYSDNLDKILSIHLKDNFQKAEEFFSFITKVLPYVLEYKIGKKVLYNETNIVMEWIADVEDMKIKTPT